MSENRSRRSFLKKTIIASTGAALGLSLGGRIDRKISKQKTARVDTHQHFWKYNTKEYGWMTDVISVLKHDFLPQDVEVELRKTGFDFSVAVEARQTVKETEWLLALAKQNEFIKAVVGWVDLRSDFLEADLQRLCRDRNLKGIRHVLHDEPDDKFMLRDDFMRGIGKLHKFGLTYDLLIRPQHIDYSIELVDKFPDQMFVVDHIAKPLIKEGKMQPWKKDLQQLAKRENVYCKLSGMVTEVSWDSWKQQDFKPYMEAVLEMFGPQRLMFGSDWPVCALAASYKQVVEIVTAFISSLSPNEQAKIMGLTAAKFYNFQL